MAGPVQQVGPPKRGSRLGMFLVVVATVVVGSLPFVSEVSTIARDAFDTFPGRHLAERIAKAAPGSTVKVGAGRYILPYKVTIAKPLHLVGAGPNQTVIMAPGDDYVLSLEGTGVTLADLTLARAPRSTGNILEVSRGKARVTNCHVVGGKRTEGYHAVSWAGAGIVVERQAELTLEKSVVRDNRGDGLASRGPVTLSNVAFLHNGDYAINLEQPARVGASHLHLEDNREGIHVMRAELELSDSILESSGTALYLGFNSHGTARNNQIMANKQGVVVEVGSTADLERNRITGNRGPGLQIDPRDPGQYGASRVTSKGNLIQD